MENETGLIDEAKNGSVEAFQKLISEHKTKIYNISYHFSGDKDLALDLSQEALLKAFKSIKQFKGQSSFGTWLYAIIRNVYLDECKKRPFKEKINHISIEQNPGLFLETGPGHGIDQNISNETFREIIRVCLLKIPPDFRLMLILYDIQGFSYEDISRTHNISLGTVKSRIHRGRNLLKVLVEKHFGNIFSE